MDGADGDALDDSCGISMKPIVAWLILALAIVLEVCGTTAMKMVERSKYWYIVVYTFYAASLGLFPLALKVVPLSISYAVWSGAGTTLTVVVATLLFKERLTWPMVASIVLIIVGVGSLNYLQASSASGDAPLLANTSTTSSSSVSVSGGGGSSVLQGSALAGSEAGPDAL